MATFLYRLGRFAFRRRNLVALVWVALLALAGVGAASASTATSSSFSIPGTEAQKAFDLLEERFPGGSADGATARVVLKAPAGEKMTSAANRAEVEKIVETGELDPDQVHLPGIFVHRIVLNASPEKRIEQRTVRAASAA